MCSSNFYVLTIKIELAGKSLEYGANFEIENKSNLSFFLFLHFTLGAFLLEIKDYKINNCYFSLFDHHVTWQTKTFISLSLSFIGRVIDTFKASIGSSISQKPIKTKRLFYIIASLLFLFFIYLFVFCTELKRYPVKTAPIKKAKKKHPEELDIYLQAQFLAGVRDREMAERLAVLDHKDLEMLVL
ncbi:hypothetical protein BpHYR1_046924 [Brachionus plicatilis]|uniref:Uncharacterized protein n=1 Tax=Brachionus plicatilis TaxID=10195 RepID=A0A3M7S5F8_BRAPC|nr:hypothetical protein BpHYR1_046924 [Brachionus plicatilis]